MRIGGVLIVDQWSYREVAKRFYPGEPRMQRKWLRAYRSVTGPRVPIGTKCDKERNARHLDAAIAYLRTTPRGYALDQPGPCGPSAPKWPESVANTPPSSRRRLALAK